MKDQTILVTGATGHQGAAIARELLRRGHFNVRALVRDAHKPSAMELRNGGVEQDVKYEQIPFEAFEKQAGKEVAIMFRWFEADGYRADLAALERKFGPPTDFKSYLRAHGWSPFAAQA